MTTIENETYENIESIPLDQMEFVNCTFDGVALCNFTDSIFNGCVLNGLWRGNNHMQSETRNIFIDCVQNETHHDSNFTKVEDYNKVVGNGNYLGDGMI